MSSLAHDADSLRRRLLEEAVPHARQLRAYRTARVTPTTEAAEALYRLERLLADLFGTEVPRRPRRTQQVRLPTVGEAITNGPLVRHFPEPKRRHVGVPVPELEE